MSPCQLLLKQNHYFANLSGITFSFTCLRAAVDIFTNTSCWWHSLTTVSPWPLLPRKHCPSSQQKNHSYSNLFNFTWFSSLLQSHPLSFYWTSQTLAPLTASPSPGPSAQSQQTTSNLWGGVTIRCTKEGRSLKNKSLPDSLVNSL